ncbi:MAG: hypothetical protein ACYTFW_26465, partial [Planctomycetota bacterium]
IAELPRINWCFLFVDVFEVYFKWGCTNTISRSVDLVVHTVKRSFGTDCRANISKPVRREKISKNQKTSFFKNS